MFLSKCLFGKKWIESIFPHKPLNFEASLRSFIISSELFFRIFVGFEVLYTFLIFKFHFHQVLLFFPICISHTKLVYKSTYVYMQE